MIHIVSLELKKTHAELRNLQRVCTVMESEFDSWTSLTGGIWLVDTPLTAGECLEHLAKFLNHGDRLFVARLDGEWRSLDLGEDRNGWLKSRNY